VVVGEVKGRRVREGKKKPVDAKGSADKGSVFIGRSRGCGWLLLCGKASRSCDNTLPLVLRLLPLLITTLVITEETAKARQ